MWDQFSSCEMLFNGESGLSLFSHSNSLASWSAWFP